MFTIAIRHCARHRAARAAFAAVSACAVLIALILSAAPSLAQDIRFFRIGTGSISGVYFPVGGTLASAISSPPGARSCDSGGSCGVPGLIAVAQATLGSIANVKAIAAGGLESALVQADVGYRAYSGLGEFASPNQLGGLRVIANLYPEALHVVVRRAGPIKSLRDLVGRRVSLDLAGSGTRELALAVLEGFGVDPASLKQVNSQIGPAADRVRRGGIDAFFFVGGFPVSALSRLARETPIRLLAVGGDQAAALRVKRPFLSPARIPAETYSKVGATDTLAVGAQWVVSAGVGDETVYGITRALWHPATRRLLDASVPAARQIRVEHALQGLGLPLHPGAERYYREKGLLKTEARP